MGSSQLMLLATRGHRAMPWQPQPVPAHLKFSCLGRLQLPGDRRATALLLQFSGYGNIFSHLVNMELNKLGRAVKLLRCL